MPRSRITRGALAAEVLANGLVTTALVASARNLNVREGSKTPRRLKRQEWQVRAWELYDIVEVFHYGAQWVGNTLSRARLVAHQNGALTTNQQALDLLESFFGGADNHGEFLRQAGIHMTVAGEGYVLGQEVDGKDEWCIAASTEVRSSTSGYKVEGEDVPDDALLIRLWRPHPRMRNVSDSPTRPLLPILTQIDELTKYVSSQLDSRLSGAGLLLLPSETVFPTPVTNGDVTAQTGLNAFISELAETMAEAKKSPEAASARVPTIVQAPGDVLDKIKHLTFWTELDQNAEALRNEAIRRLALGLDMPPEALLGTADMNHWSSWQMEESLIKSHSEPLLHLLTQCLTEGYLRVGLIALGMSEEEADTFEVVADTSEMRLRPNRSKEAIELWDRGVIKGEVVLRENGFDPENDAMDEKERAEWLTVKLAQGSPSPELVAAAVESLGLAIKVPAEMEPQEDRPLRRSLEEHPERELPDQTNDVASAALLAAGEAAVLRALERYGNRLKSSGAKIDGVPDGVAAVDRYQYVAPTKAQLDFGLQDAWGHIERLTLPAGIKHSEFEAHLDNYVRMLITSMKPYNRPLLAKYLDLVKK